MRNNEMTSIIEGLSKVSKGGVTREDLLNLKAGDIVKLDGGDTIYTVQKVNDNNIKMPEMLKKQLQDEGLYDNSYIGFMTSGNSKAPFSSEYLPIYGNSNKYVTKWFSSSVKAAVERDLKDKAMMLLQRANA